MRERIRAIVHAHIGPVADDASLEHIQSLELIAILEDLEDALDTRVHGSQVRPENVGSIDRMVVFFTESLGPPTIS